MRSLSRRLMWIVLGALVLVLVLAALAVGAMRRIDYGPAGVALPLPGQVAAIVRLIERTPASELPLVLNALNSPRMRVTVENEPPSSSGTLPMPALALAVRAYLGALDGRSLKAMVDISDDVTTPRMVVRGNYFWATHPVRLVVGLRGGGRYAVIEMRNAIAGRLSGLRFSLLVLAVTVAVALAALVLLRRQLGPLERLSAAVERFGANLETSELPDGGTKEVRDLTRAFNRLQRRIRELVAGRTRMMAAIGHDLGTYLTRLRLRIDYIADADQRARAERDIEDMHGLIAGTLALARLDHDSEAVVATDLVALLRKRADSFAAGAAPVRFHAEAEALVARVRPDAIARAFDNLISNALKYGHEADITARAADGACEVLVEDRGPGIPAAAREAVLEPFYRQDAARNLDEGGFGLGLAIVAEILERHGATIAFEDRKGGGLRVRVRLVS